MPTIDRDTIPSSSTRSTTNGSRRPASSAPRCSSPFWPAIAREYLERWVHHSQIRRALGLGSLADSPFLDVGHAIIATVAEAAPEDRRIDADDAHTAWTIGPLTLGDRGQTADLLTLAHSAEEVAALVEGPGDLVEQFAARVGRRVAP